MKKNGIHIILKVSGRFLLLLGMWIMGTMCIQAQQFQVKKFRTLPNDVSGFINPVRDLNGEACALLKIPTSSDFVFSTPLGIVKRKDEVGEIILYLPKGSSKITVKHPQWGVLRDYRFPTPLESHVAYEMTLNTPMDSMAVAALKPDTVVLRQTIVDTITIIPHKEKIPMAYHAMATVSFHTDGPSWGLFLTVMRRHGCFIHMQSDLNKEKKTTDICNQQGILVSSGDKPYYSGKTCRSNLAFTTGCIHRLSRHLCIFEGLGYGKTFTAWQLADIEGGGYVRCKDFCRRGLAVEVGALCSFKRLAVAVSCGNVAEKQWQVNVGIGIKIGRQ